MSPFVAHFCSSINVDCSSSVRGLVGFTLGTEYILSKLSIQTQVDLSMANNAFQIEENSYFSYMDEWMYDPGDDYHLLVGLSAGVNFFNAPESRNKFFGPMPYSPCDL